MQSACYDDALNSDSSLVIASPTGSGKTAVLELALAQLFAHSDEGGRGTRKLAVYMSPLKALTHERLLDWRNKLCTLSIVEVQSSPARVPSTPLSLLHRDACAAHWRFRGRIER